MEKLYLATTFAAAIVCLLTSLLLFARRKDGERSRAILAFIVLFSVLNYMTRFIALCRGDDPKVVISVYMLLTAIFMVTSYIMYPIEVISPGYLNFRRVSVLYLPWLILLVISLILIQSGVRFADYASLMDMLPDINQFQVWFRIIMVFLIFAPVISIFIIPYTRRYNNTDRIWMRKYLTIFTINTFAYLLVLSSDAVAVKTSYYFVSVSCSLAIAYMEIFERLIRKPDTEQHSEMTAELSGNCGIENTGGGKDLFVAEESGIARGGNSITEMLSGKIENYILQRSLWEDPDLSAVELYEALCTNRTTFAKAIKELGHDNFTSYINTLRVNDFIKRIESGSYTSFITAFYDAGFRSRSSAFRNFKLVTGKTPSEFFSKSTITRHE